MERKAALVGCKQSPWIRTLGMRRLQLNAKVQAETMLQVHLRNGVTVDTRIFVGPGIHKLDDAEWAQIVIAEGSYLHALCLLEGAA